MTGPAVLPVVYRAVVPGNPPHGVAQEFGSVEEALFFAFRDLRERTSRPLEIAEQGRILYNAAEIVREFRRRGSVA